MPDNFWEVFENAHDGTLKELPFFHSTNWTAFEDIRKGNFLVGKKEDLHFKEKRVFFFYGNPLYYRPEWTRPIILGLKLNKLNENASISPMDTGLIVDIESNGILRYEELARMNEGSFLKHLISTQKIDESMKLILNYIEKWFYDNESYIENMPLEKIDPENSVAFEYKNILTSDHSKTFTPKFIKNDKNRLNFDSRKACIELSVKGKVNLRKCELLFAAIPKNNYSSRNKDFLVNLFSVKNKRIIYEYATRRNHGKPNTSNEYTVKQIIEKCKRAYYKKYRFEEI